MVAACAPMPAAPTILVMPAPNKPFEVFLQDDATCRNWAAVGAQQAQAATANAQLASTVTGAVIGTAVGAAAGGHHDVGTGAAVGTAAGAAYGSGQAGVGAASSQRSYDIAYAQCMVSRGNLLPGAAVTAVPPPGPAPSAAVPPAR
jgi:hypothetical protein